MDGNPQAILQKGDTPASTLRLQLESTHLFLALLEHERNLLASGSIDDLASLVADKDRVVNQLSRLDAQLNQLLAAAGFSGGTLEINAWLTANHSESAVTRDWEELLNLTRLARQHNQTNANIISTWLQYTRQTLYALHSAAGHITLYDPKGQMA
ncbi:flagella synthesis protein FlgN [Nitrosomonas eutropha]|uniref:Flagella synthesis protein FlgN n=1 Tax=Nitrosomonas eutropha TaxID=916 RepID=A0A1I7HNK7_9PROT|nr:flagellar protein FlgN [Nitrosomonas eutropha]SFU62243.1 flagella synthesis protein FlgN [Nitrosomonas eutropha]